MTRIKSTSSKMFRWVLFIILFVTAVWRILFVALDVVAFDGDEAIVGLMAKHILEGERPLYFYGQAYMGSLDAYIIAFGFFLFGTQVWVIRVVQILLFIITVFLIIQTGKKLFGNPWIGLIAGGFLAIPPISLTFFTITSLGGYGELLLLSSLEIFLFATIREKLSQHKSMSSIWFLFLLFGSVTGLGIWTHYLTVVISLPCWIFLAIRLIATRKTNPFLPSVAFVALGFLLGVIPVVLYGAHQGWTALIESLLGKAIDQQGMAYAKQITSHLFNFVFLGIPGFFGLRPPWEAQLYFAPLLPIVIFVYVIIFQKTTKKVDLETQESNWLLVCFFLMFSILFIFSPFGVDPSGRYFIPLYIPLSLFIAEGLQIWFKTKWIGVVLVSLLLSFNVASTFSSAVKNPPGFTAYLDASTRLDHQYDLELLRFLQEHNITRGYSTYCISYPVTFRSNEKIIFVPRLSYRDNFQFNPVDQRYLPYDLEVSQSKKVSYITAKSDGMDQSLVSGFMINNITWEEKKIGDYTIYFNLSRKITPEEIFH